MHQKASERPDENDIDAFAANPDPDTAYAWKLRRLKSQGLPLAGPRAQDAMERTAASLVLAYLAANLNSNRIPLKAFMNGLEKDILLASLRLTLGSQRNAAAVLSLKPSALFEKLRKHGIRARRIKLSEKFGSNGPEERDAIPLPDPPANGEQPFFIQEYA